MTIYVVKLQKETLNLGCKTPKYLLTYLPVSKRFSLCCFKNLSLCLLHAEVPCILQCDKKGHASKKLGTNSVGLASELSLVSKLLRKVIPKKFVRSGVYYDIPLIIVSGLEMSLISGD